MPRKSSTKRCKNAMEDIKNYTIHDTFESLTRELCDVPVSKMNLGFPKHDIL
jgi:hypothetical protein